MSVTDLFNQALNLAGSRNLIGSDTEDSLEAEKCRLWYPTVRKAVLSAAFWPSARRHNTLGLLATRDVDNDWAVGDPGPGWLYAYAAPADMLRPRYLSTGARFDMETRTDNTISIVTNQEDAVLYYAIDQTNTSRWEPNLYMAIMHSLSAMVCMAISGKATRARFLMQEANNVVLEARAAEANGTDTRSDVVPEWIAARGYEPAAPRRQYVYPYTSVMSLVPQVGQGEIPNIPGATGAG